MFARRSILTISHSIAKPVARQKMCTASTPRLVSSDRAVGAWLLGVSGAVFGMVVLGGVTRLTRSGLSMVDWKPQGSLLPSTEEDWTREFEKYKAFPEYKKVNHGMELNEFKNIYFMEWAHRMWGRGLGIVFGLPCVYFVARGSIKKLPGMGGILGGLFALGGFQGLVGWWMVKSGLEEQQDSYKEPRVSPYRLTAHLSMALALYSGLLWSGLTALNPNLIPDPSSALLKARTRLNVGLFIVGFTFLSGAFVAGNDAGRAYNDWPFYAGNWFPKEIWDAKLGYRNFFENTGTVQFDHRTLAYITIITVFSLWLNRSGLPKHAVAGHNAMVAAVALQASLGISTLMLFVPTTLGALHQAGALTLWSTLVYTQHAQKYLRLIK